MARDTRPTRQPAGPGRTARRNHSARSSATPAERATPVASAAGVRVRLAQKVTRSKIGAAAGRLPRPNPRNALVLAGVLLVLALSYVNSLRTLLVQQRDLATAQQQIADRTAQVSDLEAQLQRWHDPAYVKTRAREMGWVLPGEVGYRVIGADGTVLSGSEEIKGVATTSPTDLSPRWWDRLAGSIKAADDPTPVRR